MNPTRARRFAPFAVAATAAAAGVAALFVLARRGPPPTPRACRLAVAIAVPALEAAPVELSRPVAVAGLPTCRLVRVRTTARPAPPLALVAGDAFAAPGAPGHGLVPFLVVAQRAASLLLARTPVAPHFLWHSLAARTLLLPAVGGDLGPTVAAAMLGLHAVGDVTVLRGLPVRAFLLGTGDYAAVPLWPAERMLLGGDAHFAADLAVAGGPLPAAVLAVRPEFARHHRAELASVAVAVYAAELALDGSDAGARASTSAAAFARRWPGPLRPEARRALAAALARARYAGLWPRDPRVDASLFVRLDVLRRAAGETPLAVPTVLTWPADEALHLIAPTARTP